MQPAAGDGVFADGCFNLSRQHVLLPGTIHGLERTATQGAHLHSALLHKGILCARDKQDNGVQRGCNKETTVQRTRTPEKQIEEMMEQKDTLQELFNGITPDLGQDDLFMQRLEKKLQAVEYIKQMQDKQLRQYRYAVMAAFVLGVVVSGVMFAIILGEPADLPTFSFGIESLPFLLLEENSRMLSLTGLAMLMSAGIIVIVNMWQELASMKDMHESGIKVGA